MEGWIWPAGLVFATYGIDEAPKPLSTLPSPRELIIFSCLGVLAVPASPLEQKER